jgi:hypothetical protein
MRKSETFVATEGRDKGKRFLITEMPALKAERWAIRALMALARSGVEIPDDAKGAGMAALAHAGLKALHSMTFDEVQPLLDEMWSCVQAIPNPQLPEFVRPLVMHEAEGDDLEEISTIWTLRERIFRLHTDFFLKGNQSKIGRT